MFYFKKFFNATKVGKIIVYFPYFCSIKTFFEIKH